MELLCRQRATFDIQHIWQCSAKRNVGKTLRTAKLLLVFTWSIRVQWLWVRIRWKVIVARYGAPLKLKARNRRWK